MTSALVSPKWLNEHLDAPNTVVIESVMRPVGMVFKEVSGHIPNAKKMDLDVDFSHVNSPLPHTLLTKEVFESKVRNLGVCEDSLVVIYDRQGLYSAPRAWWNFKIMGIENVFILQGGLPAWIKENYPVQKELVAGSNPGNIHCKQNNSRLVDMMSVQLVLKQKDKKVIDARSAGRFLGALPEPRKELCSGHMPNAVNLPFTDCVEDGHLVDLSILQGFFESLSCKPEQQLIFTCGSGVTACIPLLAAYQCGWQKLSLYDGAWCEWAGSRQEIIKQ